MTYFVCLFGVIVLLIVGMWFTDSVVTVAAYIACIILVAAFIIQLALAETPKWKTRR